MSETIYKLSPHRTLSLRGFDDRGAAAAMHSATATSFSLEGAFRDAADFCVLIVFDVDDYYGHQRFRYLPDSILTDCVLTFDIASVNVRPLDSTLFPSIDWPYLDVIRTDGTTAQIRLSDYFIAGAALGWQRVEVDFTARGIDDVRQMWLTFAPDPIPGIEYAGAEWLVEFDNWSVTDPSNHLTLQVAGKGSMRVHSRDALTTYAGSSWAQEASGQVGGTGWFHEGFARRGDTAGDTVTIEYWCQSTHDLYVGTSLYSDRGIVSVTVDGSPEADLDCYLSTLQPIVTRRKIAASVGAGTHTVVLEVTGTKNAASSDYFFYFDFLEAAVPSDVPDALTPNLAVGAAIDYDTEHGYKLPAARLMWMQDLCGFAGEVNLYMGVFWWAQRTNTTRVVPSATVTIPALAAVATNNVFIDASGATYGHYVTLGEDETAVAAAIAAAVNATAVGIWASSSGDTITITNRSATYSFVLTAWYEPGGAGHVDITPSGSLGGGDVGTWDIDDTTTPNINIAARKWLADLLAECATRSRDVMVAYSLELLNPPSAWAARYSDGTAVTTATGFGPNFSTHCAIGQTDFLAWQSAVFLETADLQDAAGLPVKLQCGEFVWWFFAGGAGPSMGYYDAQTMSDAATALGHSLHVFTGPDDSLSGLTADVTFLADRLAAHIATIESDVKAAYPSALIELLLPLDVNYPSVYGRYSLGGQLNNAVNIPAEFLDESTAPFDLLKIEALDFGSGTHDIDLALWAINWPLVTGTWARSNTRYLMPIFHGACPWQREYLGAVANAVPLIQLFAFDHICLMSLPLPLPIAASGARFL